MAKPKSSKGVRSENSASPSRSGSQATSTPAQRLVSASIIGVALGLVLVIVGAILTPLPPDPESESLGEAHDNASTVNQPSTGLPSDSLSNDALAAETKSDSQTAAGGYGVDTKPIVASSKLILPSSAESFEVESLQSELRALADTLPTKYAGDVGSFHVAAQVYAELKQSEKAEALWNQCLAESPRYMGPYIGFAMMLLEKGRNEEAVKVLKKAQDLGGSAPELFEKLGEAYENLGELESALAALKTGTTEYPDEASLWLILGRVQNQLNQPSDAESSLRKCLELGGDKEAALFVLNTALLRQRKTQEAAANRDELTKLKQAKGEQPDKFQDSYDFALRRIASVVFASAATLAETHDDFSEAERLYMRSLSLSPKNTEAFRGLLVVCQRQQRLADQKLLLSKLVELDSQDIISRTNLASVLLQMGDPGQAELTLKEAVQADPNGILAQAALAKLYLATGNSEGARIMAAEVVERQPTSATYRLLAAAYKASGMEEAFVAANKRADELGEAAKNVVSPN